MIYKHAYDMGRFSTVNVKPHELKDTSLSGSDVVNKMIDNGGRRLGYDRREFTYSGHIPERRATSDRRNGGDRRNGRDRREVQVQGNMFAEMRSGLERRRGLERLFNTELSAQA